MNPKREMRDPPRRLTVGLLVDFREDGQVVVATGRALEINEQHYRD
jgi:hypothetical protein